MKQSVIKYESQDGSLKYELVFIQKANLIYTSRGKSWPIHTQCLLIENGLLQSFGTVVKHAEDPDNFKYAITASAKKALSTYNHKSIRRELWKIIFELIEVGEWDATL